MPHRRSSSSSPILSLPLLIIILPIILLLFLFVALPPFLSFTSQLLRPTSVKKSWDSLNILFVLFAILCGVFAKRNDEDSPSEEEEVETVRARATGYDKSVEREDGSVSRQWYGFSENKIYDSPPIVRLQSPVAGVSRLRRSSSSYPDLRQESLWETESDRYRGFRFFDDFEIDKFRSPEKEQIPVENPDRQENVEKVGEDADVKEIQVDTVEIRSSSPLPSQSAPKSPTPPVSPPPPPPPPATTRPKSRRTYQTVWRKEKLESVEIDDNDITGNPSPPRPPSPPPPPSAPAVQTEWEHKRGRNQRRKSEIAVMWASLLNKKKRKGKQRTAAAKVDHIHNEDNVSARQPPPPPPPPPPPSVFHSWFKKGVGKNKKIHSVSTPPPPAPPPPPPPLTSSKRWSFRKPKIPPPPPPPLPPATEPRRRRNAGRPPLPTRTSTFNNETLLNSGDQSPLIAIPPPPPPPPFKIPEMKFTVRGDFVKIRSTNSSRCGSPEREDDPKPTEDPPEMEMGGTIPCPSPDVNVKASTFIARLRGEWKLEKINSMKEKQNLGLYGPGPTRGPSSSWH
ncbi:hypothetical protein QN277_007374 [Acacia crassicarpa]|uniref:Uncharacterized protein n=1 Tax=Acacia crassicarpa TaxID=499986 RepID=A0AAE1JRA5_9FABA|nr:hypothetical protein QN277_007374 [Acacia crassicarpa]